MKRRLPAEWEDQDGVLLAWPHERTDWLPCLDVVEDNFAEIIKHVSRFERVVLITQKKPDVYKKLKRAGAVMERIQFCDIDTNDSWSRDFGPITVFDRGKPLILNFGFNGWGLKFAADLDNQINRRLRDLGIFGDTPFHTPGIILEGGSIESDGSGTILTTAECLLSPNRNPHLTRNEIEGVLGDLLGSDRVLWLESGYLAGDDTDSHVDTLARLCPEDTIVHVSCDDPQDEHYDAIGAMIENLRGFRTIDGRPYRLIPLPWPDPHHDESGQRLPATYANFLIINGAVLVPTYEDRKDELALETLKQVFPDREVIGINCSSLILQHGSLHCVTMQIPRGVLI
jgi:agmatine deiminase